MAWCLGKQRLPRPVSHTLDAEPDKDPSPSNLLDLLDRIYARSGERSGAFDVLAWAGDNVLFAEAKHGGKDALRLSQKAWIEAALEEGVPLESLLVVEWGFGSKAEGALGGYTVAGVDHNYLAPGAASARPSPPNGMPATPPVDRTRSDAEPPTASVTINEGNATTSTRRVKPSLRADGPSPGSEAVEMRLMNGGGEPWTEWRKYAPRVDWKLSKGEGQKVVYVQFKNRAGNKSDPVKAAITLRSRVGGGDRSGEDSIRTSRRLGEPQYPEARTSDSKSSSRLTAGGLVPPPIEGPEVFFDAYDQDSHGKFLRWRERNQGGYVISRRSPSDAMLHQADCGHFELGTRA